MTDDEQRSSDIALELQHAQSANADVTTQAFDEIEPLMARVRRLLPP